MPQIKQVHSLYFQCLNCIFENIYEVILNGVDTKTLERMRKHYVSNLHGGIKDHFLKLAVVKDRNRIQVILQLINLLADSSVSYLCPSSGPGFLLADHYSTLIHHLKNRECTGLKSLYIRVAYSDRSKGKEEETVAKANKLFYSLLLKGLANNLTVLVLDGCCDNEILKLLGQHCTHLTKLDVRNSWFVDDNGCKYLCLKDPTCIQEISEGDTHTPQLLLKLMAMKEESLNPCCFSLYDVRIQDTNTSDLTVLMLLIFIRNLRTLGGFIYFRSVGDNIVFLSRLAREGLRLNLTELWDTHFTDNKLQHLSLALPYLTTVYTRINQLQPLVAKFKHLADISIDFDDFNSYEDVFFNFLSCGGSQLRRITLIDQTSYINLPRILDLCPNLLEITGAFTIGHVTKKITAEYLIRARVRAYEAKTIMWIFNNTRNLEHLEVILAYPINYFVHYDVNSEFDNGSLEEITKRKPECFETLTFFNLRISQSREFKLKTIMKFISECKQLKLIGDLGTWSVSEKVLNKIQSQLRKKNLQVDIIYKDNCVPYITMQNIKEFTPLDEVSSKKKYEQRSGRVS